MEHRITVPAYRSIAIEIARDIANGRYLENQRLSGRTVLASTYGVSPETIRKAVHILKDVGILDTERGSGVEVLSVEKAREFTERQSETERIVNTQREIVKWSQKQADEFKQITDKINYIVSASERLKLIDTLAPCEIEVKAQCQAVGKSIGEVRFWQNTGATVVAIKRQEGLILSPGPYAIISPCDIFYVVGDEKAYHLAKQLLQN